VLDPARRGKPLDLQLLAAYRAAAGPRRRHLLGQLVWENEPLVTVLVDQLRGHGTPSARDVKLGGTDRLGELDWEDAKQAGMLTLAEALDAYDPTKGKLAYFLKQRIRYALQCMVERDGLTKLSRQQARAPKGVDSDELQLDLVGEQCELDECSRGHELGGALEGGITEADVARWQRTGAWPETAEEAAADCAQARAAEAEAARALAAAAERERVVRAAAEERLRLTGLRTDAAGWFTEVVLPRMFRYRRAGRLDVWAAHNSYRLGCRREQLPELPRGAFVQALHAAASTPLRVVQIRAHWTKSASGLAGVELASSGVSSVLATA